MEDAPSLYAALRPVLIDAATLVLTAAVVWAGSLFSKWTGMQVEAGHREALHSAMKTGVRAALEKLGPQATDRELVDHARVHAERSVPDAIAELKPHSDVLNKIASSKIPDAKAAVAAGT